MFPLCPLCVSFYHKWMLNFIKSFFCIYWDDHMVFILQFVNWCITLIDLQILTNLCIPGINPTWSWCMIILIYCCYFVEYFCTYVHQWCWSAFFKKFKFVWKHKKPNSQNNIKKEVLSWRNHAPWLQAILQSYSNQNSMVLAQKETNRSMEQDKKPTNKPMHLRSFNLRQRRQEYSMEKRLSLP